MDKNKNDESKKSSESMLKEKTNQDFNKQKPNPNDPNQVKNHEAGEDEDIENKQKEVTDKSESN